MRMCWLIRRALGAYEDRMLGGRSAQRVGRHLQACPTCQREFRERQRLTLLLRSLQGPSRPPEYWPHALLQLQRKIQQRPRYPLRSALLDYLRSSAGNPAQALLPVTVVSMALFNTVTFLGLEAEAVVFFTSYLLPYVLE
jgi:hypothetical protein